MTRRSDRQHMAIWAQGSGDGPQREDAAGREGLGWALSQEGCSDPHRTAGLLGEEANSQTWPGRQTSISRQKEKRRFCARRGPRGMAEASPSHGSPRKITAPVATSSASHPPWQHRTAHLGGRSATGTGAVSPGPCPSRPGTQSAGAAGEGTSARLPGEGKRACGHRH